MPGSALAVPLRTATNTMDANSKLPKRASKKARILPGNGKGRLAPAGFNPNVTVKMVDGVDKGQKGAENEETSAAATAARPALTGDSDALLAFSSRQAALAQAANRPKSSSGRRYSTAEEESAENAAAEGAGRIRVFVRLRPVEASELARKGGPCCLHDAEENPNSVEVLEPAHRSQLDHKKFDFDRVLGPTTNNDEVFKLACRPLVDAVLNGFNGTLMAYGQTGTGKTYTMGSMASYSKTQGFTSQGLDSGMIPRVVDYLFEKTSKDLANEYQFKVAFVQIYQDDVYDLLSLEGSGGGGGGSSHNLLGNTLGSSVNLGSSVSLGSTFRGRPGDDDPSKLQVRESPSRGAYIAGLTEMQVGSPSAVMEMLNRGRKKLVFAETKMNRQSSRSHAICFITTECIVPTNKAEEGNIPRPTSTSTALSIKSSASASTGGKHSKGGKGADSSKPEDEKQLKVRGKITLCDLAGSERVKKTGNVDGDRLAEAQHINSSLLELGNVVAALAAKSKRSGDATGSVHIPFRNSTLTRVLSDSLGGNCKTSLLICCSPFMRDQGETRGSMMFGARAMQIAQHARINVDLDYRHLANDLARQLEVKAVAWSTLEDSLRRRIAKLEDEMTAMATSQLQDNEAIAQAYEAKLAAAQALSDATADAIRAQHTAEIAKLNKMMRATAEAQQAKDQAQKKKEAAAALANAQAMAKQRKERKERQKQDGTKTSEMHAESEALNQRVTELAASLAAVTEERQALLLRAADAANEHAHALEDAAAQRESVEAVSATTNAQLAADLAGTAAERDALVGMTADLTDKLADVEAKLESHLSSMEATEAAVEARLAGELEAKQEATISAMYNNLADLAADNSKEERDAAVAAAVAVVKEEANLALEVAANELTAMQKCTDDLEGTVQRLEQSVSVQAAAVRKEKDERQRTQQKLAEGFALEEAAALALRQETEMLTYEIAMLRAKMPTAEMGCQTEQIQEAEEEEEEVPAARKKKWLCF